MRINRRSALKSGLAISGLGLLPGCWPFTRPVTEACFSDPSLSDPTTPLTIDMHAHVFNGADLQVGGFLELVVLPNTPILRPLSQLVQNLAWDVAPSAKAELDELMSLKSQIEGCRPDQVAQIANDHAERAYTNGVTELKRAEKVSHGATAAAMGSAAAMVVQSQIESLPATYAEYKRQSVTMVPSGIGLKGALDFILRNFQYRFVNLFDYLHTYSGGTKRKVDLVIAHLVDYDWGVGMGQPTHSSFDDQLRVMEAISILSGGRVACFAPFDPMKEVMHRVDNTRPSSLKVAHEAVEQHGFIGVKMYPPMGFRPSGNKSLDPSSWNWPWLPSTLQNAQIGSEKLGGLLDEALGDLYAWCLDKRIPIMAHSAPTNSPSPLYHDLFMKPEAWQGVPAGLQVDFGHFGDTDEGSDGTVRAQQFSDLMTGSGGSEGERFFADSGYFADCLTQPTVLQNDLKLLFRASATKGDAALAQRLMYGSDWEMVTIEGGGVDQYLTRFEQIFSALDGENNMGNQSGTLSDRFFGLNAVEFLGLRKSPSADTTRSRLERFYAARGVATPIWARKVDQLPAR